jgi:ferredoxin
MRLTRRIVQLGFLVLTIVGVFVVSGNAERWCPFGGVEAIYNYSVEGNMLCSLGVSNLYVLAAVLLTVVLFRRAFCGYVCPIGTISELLGRGAERVGAPHACVTGAADAVLRSLKYIVFGIILYLTLDAAELVFRKFDPCYALISRHGEDITMWSYIVAGAVVLASLALTLPFCRWFCPLAAVMNPLSRFGLTRVRRDDDACTGCGKCSGVCPAAIPVDQVASVGHARCISCLNCVEACPAKKKGALRWGPPAILGRRWPQGALVGGIMVLLGMAVVTAQLVPLPSFVQSRGEAPGNAAAVELQMTELTCRGRGTLLWYLLERDDFNALPGYLRVEAWPGPGTVRVIVHYDPAQCTELQIKQAITEPYFDAAEGRWRASPFAIEGYDPLAGLGL